MLLFQISPLLKYNFSFNKMYSVFKKKLQGVMKKVQCLCGIFFEAWSARWYRNRFYSESYKQRIFYFF